MWSAADASPLRLGELARQFESSGRWKSFLSPQEHQLFAAALQSSPETWARFLDGRVQCRLRVLQAEDSGQGEDMVDVDSSKLALRVRYMLLDSLLMQNETHPPTPNSAANSAAITPPTPAPNAKNDDESDYDDEEEEIAEQPVLETLIVETRLEDLEPDIKGRALAVHNAGLMYDTFEQDSEQLRMYKRLKESDNQIQDGNTNTLSLDAANVQPIRAKHAEFGSANLCLKYLLAKVETNRSDLDVSDSELRTLINDVRKNRSKWASEDRIGQEELYEACEQVVMELRGTTEHSTPFLNKVSKRDAPNYYDVIKTPMDLNTVTRKLRLLQYDSKQSFLDDLNLIWSNCLLYNSDPRHFLRAHAIAMRKKTLALAQLIPDIQILLRSEVEAQAEQHAKKRRHSTPVSSKAQKGQKRKIFKGEKGTKSTDEHEENGEQEGEEKEVKEGEKKEEEEKEVKEGEEKEKEEKVKEGEENEKGEGGGGEGENDDLDKEPSTAPSEPDSDSRKNSVTDEEYSAPDVETAFWDSATRKTRIQLILNRKALFSNNQLQMDAPIIPRSPLLMYQFDKTMSGKSASNNVNNLTFLDSETDTEDPFLVEYMVSAGMPAPLAPEPAKLEVPKLESLPPSRYKPQGLLNTLVLKNLNDMQMIRRLCTKILYVKDLQVNDFQPTDPNMAAYQQNQEFGQVLDAEEDISSRLPQAAKLDFRASSAAMQQAVAKLAMLAGFQTTETKAVETLTSIACDYMSKLARTLNANLEAPRSSSSFTKVVNMSLGEMGVTKLNQLTTHISNDVLRRGRRFSRFKQRLNKMLVEMLRPEVEKYKDEQFGDNSDQFVLGQFSSELGDDYFGFKELGIDKELGIANISIPFHLLQQRVNYNGPRVLSKGAQEVYLENQEYPPLTNETVAAIPSVLRPMFSKYMQDLQNSSMSVPELVEKNLAAANSARARITVNIKPGSKKRKFVHAFVKPEPEKEPEPTAEEPENQTDTKDPQTDPKTDPKADPKTDPKADPKTDPKTEPKTEGEQGAEGEAGSKPQPQPQPQNTTEPQNGSEPQPHPNQSGTDAKHIEPVDPLNPNIDVSLEMDKDLQDDIDLFGEDDLAKNGFSLDDGIGTTSLLL